MSGSTEAAERRVRGRRAPGEPPGPPPAGEGRFSPRLRSPRGVLVGGVLVLVLLLLCVWALYGSSWLRVEKVSVAGTRVLAEAEVREAAAVPLDIPLASVDKAAAAKRVRDELPRVREVRVVRAWPNGVGVHVTERRAVLLVRVRDAGGGAARYLEVDASGVQFGPPRKTPGGIPLLRLQGGQGEADEERSRPAVLRRAAAEVVTALPGSVRKDARRVEVGSYDDITVELTEGRSVRWGGPERGTAKAKALTAVMRAAPDAKRFDVSAPGAPAVSSA